MSVLLTATSASRKKCHWELDSPFASSTTYHSPSSLLLLLFFFFFPSSHHSKLLCVAYGISSTQPRHFTTIVVVVSCISLLPRQTRTRCLSFCQSFLFGYRFCCNSTVFLFQLSFFGVDRKTNKTPTESPRSVVYRRKI